jgi:ABC-2 type transport system permease protein
MKSFMALLHVEVLDVIRDRVTVLFTFAFPIIFVLIFSVLITGVSSSQTAKLGLLITEQAPEDKLINVISQVDAIAISAMPDEVSLEEALSRKQVDFGLIWNGESLRFLYDPTRVQDNYTFQELARGISSTFLLRQQDLNPVLSMDKIHVGKPAATNPFNLVVPGIIAFSILSAGLSAISGHLTAMKQRKLLDRFVVTPMCPVLLLAAIATVRLVIVFLSTLITLFVAISLLGLTFEINWLHYTVFILAATIGSMGFGTVIALLVRHPDAASNVAHILAMMMMFLAGIYFPVEIMPSYLRTLSKVLPLTYMADAMRYATGVSDMSAFKFWAITGALGLSAIVLFPFLAHYVVRADRS